MHCNTGGTARAALPARFGQRWRGTMRSHLPSRFKRPTVWPKRQRRRNGSDDVHHLLPPSCSAEQASGEACAAGGEAYGEACDEACDEACGCHRVQVRCPFPAGANAGAPNGALVKGVLLCIEWPAQDVMQAQKLAELAARLLRRRRCTAVQPSLRWRVLLGRFVDTLRDARQPDSSSTSKTSGRGPSESPGEVVQVCLSAGRDAAFYRRLPLRMPISDVKRLLLAAWCSKLANPAKPPRDVAEGVERLWPQSWLTCDGRSLDESSTLKASNVGADATITLQVCCPPLLFYRYCDIRSRECLNHSLNA